MRGIDAGRAGFRFGPFELDTRTGELLNAGHSTKLAPQPAKLLLLLVSQVVRDAIVPDVRCAAQLFLFEHEQHVPVQMRAHVRDDAGRHVRVGVDARPRDEALGVRPQFGG